MRYGRPIDLYLIPRKKENGFMPKVCTQLQEKWR